jgi:hypothetical protein
MIITLVNVVLITPIYLLQTIVALFQPDYMDPFWYWTGDAYWKISNDTTYAIPGHFVVDISR